MARAVSDYERQLEKLLQEAERRAQKAEEQRRPTTFSEYIEACHNYLFANFTVQPNKSLTSNGYRTKPQGKRCPTRLLPWSNFLEQQRNILGRLYSVYPAEARDFESLDFLRALGKRIAKRKVGNEKDLEHIQHDTVEAPVTSIIDCLRLLDEAGDEFTLGNGIIFENHPNVASDGAEEPQERLRSQQLPPNTPGRSGPDLNQLRADQICVYMYDKDDLTRRKLAFVVEYKAPHKLTLHHLRLGLREMNIYNDVVNRSTKPVSDDKDALFQYHSDELVAAAVAQTFHYMIEGGLEYSYLTTGQAIVFLKIDWDDPTTLFYHLAEPGHEVRAHPENFRHCTAVSQVLAFSLLALGSITHGQNDRHNAILKLNCWDEDYESILYAIPETELKQAPPTSAFQPRTYSHVDRSPYLLRFSKKQSFGACRPESCHTSRDHPTPDASDDESDLPDTPTRQTDQTRSRLYRQSRGGDRSGSLSEYDGQTRPYCTQKCLLGLIRRGVLDGKCPNIALHCQEQRPHYQYHPISHKTWLTLMHEQLARTLDEDIEPLAKQGARGILFRVTLRSYGYTVIAKGTVLAFLRDLRHEASVYHRLQTLQGVCVPVCLGAVDLAQVYYYDFQVRVVHLMFLSWAGDSPNDGNVEVGQQKLTQELVRSVHAIHQAGVLHRDVSTSNALWSHEVRRVMLIDFERSAILGPPRQPLAPTISNLKRKYSSDKVQSGVKGIRANSKSGGLGHDFHMRVEVSIAEKVFSAIGGHHGSKCRQ